MIRSLCAISTTLTLAVATLGCAPAVEGSTTAGMAARKTLCRLVETRQLDQAEVSPLGFSAMELVERMTRTVMLPIEWQRTDGVSYGPERGIESVTVSLAAPAGRVVYRDYEPLASDTLACSDSLEMTFDVRVRTSGGAFDERFPALFVTDDQRILATTHSLLPTELAGSLVAKDTDGRSLTALQVALEVSSQGHAGELRATFNSPPARGANGSTRDVVLARWGLRVVDKP